MVGRAQFSHTHLAVLDASMEEAVALESSVRRDLSDGALNGSEVALLVTRYTLAPPPRGLRES